jgi:hypothetical protein
MTDLGLCGAIHLVPDIAIDGQVEVLMAFPFADVDVG